METNYGHKASFVKTFPDGLKLTYQLPESFYHQNRKLKMAVNGRDYSSSSSYLHPA